MSAGIAGAVATSGAPVLIPEAYKDTRFNKSVDLKTGFKTRNILCVPIRHRSGRVLGVAQLINKEGGVISGNRDPHRADGVDDSTDGDGGNATFSGDDQRFLEVFASQAAAAIYSSGMLEHEQALMAPSSSPSITIDEAKAAAAEAKGAPAADGPGDTKPVKIVGVPGVYHVPRRANLKSKATQTDSADAQADNSKKDEVKQVDHPHAEPKVAADGDTGAAGSITGGDAPGVLAGTPTPAPPTGLAPPIAVNIATNVVTNGEKGAEDPAVRALLEAAFNSYDKFDALALAQLTDGHPLSTLGEYLFEQLGLNEAFGIDPVKLRNFLSVIEEGYDDGSNIPYHNRAHAASVMHMTHAMLHLGGAAQLVGAGHWFRPWLQLQDDTTHDEAGAPGDTATSGGTPATETGAFEVLACLLAAVVHDFEHIGKSNDYLIHTHHERAIRNNDRSVNENHHVAAAYAVMRRPACNFLDVLPHHDYRALRQLVIELVVSTDMAHHKEVVDGIKEALDEHTTKAEELAQAQAAARDEKGHGRAEEEENDEEVVTHEYDDDGMPGTAPKLLLQRVSPGLPYNQDQDETTNAVAAPYIVASKLQAQLVLKMVLKCADVGHLALPWRSHLSWCERLEEEFFLQGDLEKSLIMSPSFLMDRDKPGVTDTQVGFFDFIVLPLFRSLAGALPGTVPVLSQVQANYTTWVALEAAKKSGALGGEV